MKKLKYVVVGTGRSGTVFMARLLSSLGFPCGHESIFTAFGIREAVRRLKNPKRINKSPLTNKICKDWDIKDSEIVADSSYMAAPYLNHSVLNDATVIHIVRNPLKVTSSFVFGFHYFYKTELTSDAIDTDTGWYYHNFIYKHVPQVKAPMDICSRACLYYVLWNKMVERNSVGKQYIRLRIEDNNEETIRKLLDVHDKEAYKDKTVNKIRYDIEFSLGDIRLSGIKKDLQVMMLKYGYLDTNKVWLGTK